MSERDDPRDDEPWNPWVIPADEPDPTLRRAASTPPPAETNPTLPIDVPPTESVPASGETQWGGAPMAYPSMWEQPSMPPPVEVPQRRPRKAPGWGAVTGIALASALVAGLIGGVGGGWLGSNGYLKMDGSSNYTAPAPVDGATDRPAGTIANISARTLPSVVTIRVDGADGRGTGSGWVFDDQGHIVTNNHVIEGAADRGTIVVQLSNGKQIDATIAGRDASYDLAVLKTDRTDLAPLPTGVSSEVVVGDQVIAMGAPLGLESSVTAGIVSALNRPVSVGGGEDQSFINAIQTDAAINPGNSGGPLLDMQGRVIGVNSAIARVPGLNAQSGNIGVGFAIPSDQVRKTVEQLIRTGKAEHPIIGVLLDRSYNGEGIKIADEGSQGLQPVTPGGPADRAGLQPGDVIIAFEGRPMANPDELVVAIRARSVGDSVTLTVRRDGTDRDVTMTLQGRTND